MDWFLQIMYPYRMETYDNALFHKDKSNSNFKVQCPLGNFGDDGQGQLVWPIFHTFRLVKTRRWTTKECQQIHDRKGHPNSWSLNESVPEACLWQFFWLFSHTHSVHLRKDWNQELALWCRPSTKWVQLGWRNSRRTKLPNGRWFGALHGIILIGRWPCLSFELPSIQQSCICALRVLKLCLLHIWSRLRTNG